MARQHNILISGAGIAGPALALLLSRAGHKCTVVERAPSLRTSGQQIDVEGEGLKVVRALGIEDDIVARRVEDGGIKFVETDDTVIAEFPASQGGRTALVKEYEIMRPDLADVLYQRTKDVVIYRFDETISKVEQDEHGVTVQFTNSLAKETFDLVVAADGLRSSTRTLAFAPGNTEIVSLGQYVGLLSIPWQESDGNWSRWCNATDGRTVCTRPREKDRVTGAYLCQISEDGSRIASLPISEQIQEVAKTFADVGWETDRIVRELQKGDASEKDFYVQEVAQSKSKSLSSGRIVLLGDAGYCPSPLSGQGTTLAFIGAYILAGCIGSNDGDLDEALRQYEGQVRPFIKSAQSLPPGVPRLLNPQTETGLQILKGVLWTVGKVQATGIATAMGKIAEKIPFVGGNTLKLPEYAM